MKRIVAVCVAIWACALCAAAMIFTNPAFVEALSATGSRFAPGNTPWSTEPPTGLTEDRFDSRRRTSLLVVGQKTTAPRTTDTLETAHEEKLETVAERVRLREMEDAFFVYKAKHVGWRMQSYFNKSEDRPTFAFPKTGVEFLEALVSASRRAPIANLVVFGHSGPIGFYMREDRGFYRSIGEIARASRMVDGAVAEKEEKLRALGARDLGDLQELIKSNEIKFASDAVIVLTGCSAAGETDVTPDGIAGKIADITGAIVFGSVNVTDDSIAEGAGRLWSNEYSTGSWVRFERGSKPTDLNSHSLDVLERLNLRRFQEGIRRFQG
jgi:hypothetical protein